MGAYAALDAPARRPFSVGGNSMPVNARILIVEDDFATRQSLAALLRQMGHTPIVADRADDGMRVLRSSENLDIIITDVVMPGMNGIEFSEHVRKARPGLPIVLVTGDADALDAVLASGAVALLKPYSPDTLRRVLKEAMESRQI
jgi:DNA-binding NtrC family response regulator